MVIQKLINQSAPTDLDEFIHHISTLISLLDSIPNIVFFVKNTEAQYIFINETLVKRLGFNQKSDILGLTSCQIFGVECGYDYTLQDFKVLEGKAIKDKLELHTYLSGCLGWCITHKIPIYNRQNHIIAMAGVSIDIDKDDSSILKQHKRLAFAVEYIKQNLERKITVSDIAKTANMSISQLERIFKSVLNLSPLQMIQKLRLELALSLLRESDKPIIEIAMLCGYADHSAFSRQFKKLTGYSPQVFRRKNHIAQSK